MTFHLETPYWTSLAALPNLQLHQFIAPALPPKYPNGTDRVNHAKFMQSRGDKRTVTVFATSNWAGDYQYFKYFAGGSYIFNASASTSLDIAEQVRYVFERDWASPYVNPWKK